MDKNFLRHCERLVRFFFTESNVKPHLLDGVCDQFLFFSACTVCSSSILVYCQLLDSFACVTLLPPKDP